MEKFELIKFIDDGLSIDVKVDPSEDTVWLTAEEISQLFDRDRTVISRHISRIYSTNELDIDTTCAKNAHMGHTGQEQIYFTKYYNLDVILSVGYRVNSKKGIAFRRWANTILKDYLIKGYAVNERRLIALNKTIEIQSKIISSAYDIEVQDIKKE